MLERRRVIDVPLVVCLSLASIACARLPYQTQSVQQNNRILVSLQKEVSGATYTHPVTFTPGEMAALLQHFSIREKKSVILRWFAEEKPPVPLFREDELKALVPPLVEAFQKVGPDERVYFEIYAPGPNPNYDRDTTAGWMAVHEQNLYLQIVYFHTLTPVRKIDQYDYNFPLIRPTPGTYVLYFEPGRFWVTDETFRDRAVDFRAFLKSPEGTTKP
jgi:hypothetical protein